MYRKWVYVDEVTGSRMGYTEYLTMVRREKWIILSKYENALGAIGKPVASRKYVSCAGTGYNIWGRAVLYGHGMPTEAAMQIDLVLDAWMAGNGKERLLALVNEKGIPIEIVYNEGMKIIAQQVDSAEASTIAVPPSKASGSPR